MRWPGCWATPGSSPSSPRNSSARARPQPPSPSVLAEQIRAGELGDVVLVAGHSNTIPEILAALGATAPPPITEAEFDNLYVAAVSAEAAQLVHLRYGAR